jgi:6-phosphogluconolactonase
VSVDRSGSVVLVANYASGTVAVLPIEAGGALGHATQVIQHRGSGPNAARQEGPHAHCILAHPSNRFALAADLGMDRVLLYRLDVENRSLLHADGDAVMRPGTGPRHLAFHPSLPLVFVSGELDSTVTALHCDAESGAMSTLQTVSTLPAGWTGANFPADIHVAPSGRTLYVSNRGHDSIAVLSVAPATGALALEQVVSTGGAWPRNFSLDPRGRWLLVANQRSSSIVVFERDLESGRLTPTAQRIAVPSPVCLRFAAHAGAAA